MTVTMAMRGRAGLGGGPGGFRPRFVEGITMRICRPCRQVCGLYKFVCPHCGQATVTTKVYNLPN